ncbi:MAG: 4-amino-4-deoxy-L-arabinose transferase and related glycosyltransferases of PMT family [Phormidesmis priestleyi Ana]|uniref:4-amino-4-deoxy-L-arabinose transferase and related glycosyltransferases of PMT family n=1 Tax=Phormidesmis priestleyi Ana TaxID=1666911 RepID=A0A0P7ZRH3_9CYAN|nr:MAG: 4-amino-4-deoxy-L-arabinose transferase and related glycosyltransferases of PMT family [Phormidesmis priestleyi Ana]
MNYLKRAVGRFPLLFLTLLALVPRVYHLDAPVIGVHSWRQADTAAIARNFYETMLAHPGLSELWRFAYPQVDWGGGGYAETEFPLYPALVSLLYRLFGPHEVYARGLSVVFSVVGLYFLYRLVTLCFDRTVAFWSALFYAILPLSVFYGRTIQPESLVIMSSLGGLYYFWRWLAGVRLAGVNQEQEENRDRERQSLTPLRFFGNGQNLFFSGIFVAIALLLKVLPMVYVGLPLLFLAAIKFRFKIFWQWQLWLYALGILGVTALWYMHAHNIFLASGLTFGFWSGDTDRYTFSSLLSVQYWLDIIFRVMVRHFAVVGFFVALVGLTFQRQKAADWMWEVGLLSSFLAGALAPASSYVHEYYQLPVMFFGVVFVGKVFARVFAFPGTARPALTLQKNQKRARWHQPALTVALVLTLLTGSTIYAIDYMKLERSADSTVYALAELVQKNTPPGAKLLVTTGGDPTLLYLSHRQGWMISPDEVSAERIEAAAGDGADFLVGSYEIVQSYAEFVDESQKENIRALLRQGRSPLVNNERAFIAPL